MPRMIALFSTLMLASACSVSPSGAGVGTVSSASRPATPAFRAPTAMGTAGLEGIIGERAGSLVRRFGEARIDLAEGDARKLQFTSDRCVLDVFLYPLEANGEPVATHVVARERKGGGEADRVGCIGEIERSAGRR